MFTVIRKYRRIALSLALLSVTATNSYANLLNNNSFEIPEITSGGTATVTGEWGGDVSHIVTAENGIAPLTGNRMLQFLHTGFIGGSGSGISSGVLQFIDLKPYANTIAAGNLSIKASAFFNRVLGDIETDTEFNVDLLFYNSASVPTNINHYISFHQSELFADGDVNTWEELTNVARVPTTATYVGVQVAAVENVANDVSGIEFDGHYADLVRVQLISAPNVISLLVLASLSALFKQKKRHAL